MEYKLREATLDDLPIIWDIIQKAIIRRKKDGSEQWQDGYPNPRVLQNDLDEGTGYVLISKNNTILGYCSIGINNEPEYDKIKGKWLSTNDYIVIHRVAIDEKHLGKGLAKFIFMLIEEIALNQNIFSLKSDTNHDNFPMLHIFNLLDYTYCGIVHFRGTPRKAFEKILSGL